MEDGGWKLECAHSSDLRRQPRIDRGRERGGGRQKQALNNWSRKENEDPAGQHFSSCLHPTQTGGRAYPSGLSAWSLEVPVEATASWSIEPALCPAVLPSPRCCWVMPISGTALWQRCHPPGVLAGDIPSHGFTSTSIPLTDVRQMSQLPWLLHFALVFETMGEAELCPILPAARSSLPLQQHRLQLRQPFPVTKSCSFFFSFSVVSRGGGDWQGAAGKDAWPCPQVWGWPRPSPERLERCHGCGQRGNGAGWDGGGLLWVGAEVGWVQGGESAYRPHRCSQPTCQQTSESPSTAPCPQDPTGSRWCGTNSAHGRGHRWVDGLSLHGCARQARSKQKALPPLKLPVHKSIGAGKQVCVSTMDTAHRWHGAGPQLLSSYTSPVRSPCSPLPNLCPSQCTGSITPWAEVALEALGPCKVLLRQTF